ncbi:MAG: glycine--tRNA ligase subunit beta, partial [Acidobacteriota bacterium]|nr:glycine--tRNA ligase subunit beta [Acidobacteriota bacterium]
TKAEVKRDDFLFEIRTEEIPAATLSAAREDLARGVSDALSQEGLAPEAVESFATPRRLVVLARGVPDRQSDRETEVLGPPAATAFGADGKPTRAAEGFARAQKVEVSELVVVDSARGKTVAVRRTVPGRAAADVIAEAVPRVVGALTFPKTMRWGAGERAFVRPVRGVLALFGGRVVPMEVMGVRSGNATVGHRVLSEGKVTIAAPDEYLSKLRGAYVEPDGGARRDAILESSKRLASHVGGKIDADSDLAAVLADLVEWPGLVRGSFDPEFLELPEEITTTAMKVHQKFLPVRGPDGLLPHFIAVMDNSADRRGFIAKGCEWVLNARLADARFFFREDSRESLESRLPELERLTFQERLGSYAAKTARLEELAAAIAEAVGRRDLLAEVRMAARLSKADLTTRMVREFTDLQGVVGGLYARAEGKPEPVWKAISDQYRPQGQADDPPREAAGAVLSLADRFDTLAGFFLLGLVPTGSKDPYGLRRAAAGVVAIAVAFGWRHDWSKVAARAIALYPADLSETPPDRTLRALEEFFRDRLRNFLERRGSSYDEVAAVTRVGTWDFADAAERAAALTEARRRLDFRSLVLAFKRIRNILEGATLTEPSPDLYREDAERALAADFLAKKARLAELISGRRYPEALETIASISPSLDRFFVEVLVNAPEEDVRRNRHALLGAIQREFSKIADFSEIVVEKQEA